MKAVAALSAVALCAQGLNLRSAQEPDTSCGKGFEELVDGSKAYFATAQEALWKHPGQTGQDGTFEQELQCWFANMVTTKCDSLPSQYDKRNADLTAKCSGVGEDWLQIWKMFSPAEIQYYKKNFPAEPIAEEDPIHYKQAMKTAVDLNKREILCMTLFNIDDECGAHSHIRLAKK